MRAPALGELASPIDSLASISTRKAPVTSLTTQSLRIRDATGTKLGLNTELSQACVDLRLGTGYQHQANAEGMQQDEVVYEVGKSVFVDRGTGELYDKRLPAMCVDVGRRTAKARDKLAAQGLSLESGRTVVGVINTWQISHDRVGPKPGGAQLVGRANAFRSLIPARPSLFVLR